MPQNKTANFFADELYLRIGDKVRVILEVIDSIRGKVNLQEANLEDVENAIKHVLRER